VLKEVRESRPLPNIQLDTIQARLRLRSPKQGLVGDSIRGQNERQLGRRIALALVAY
jgi:hypothetical protein